MNLKVIPIFMVVLSSLFYHTSQKSTPPGLSPIVTLIVTYVTASFVSIVAYFVFNSKSNLGHLVEAVGSANWASYLLGFAVVGLELGYLLAYRAGWHIGSASLLANTLVSILLIPIGFLLFKESLSLQTISGVIICILGLVLVSK